MNKQYEAIIALDRSSRNLAEWGWTRGELGYDKDPKCAVGVLSIVMTGLPSEIGDQWFILSYPREAMVGRVAARALFEALDPEQLDALRERCEALDSGHAPEYRMMARAFKVASTGNATHSQYSGLVIVANDKVMEDEHAVRQWFSDAIDVLAQDLPVPAGPLFEQAEKITTAGRVVV